MAEPLYIPDVSAQSDIGGPPEQESQLSGLGTAFSSGAHSTFGNSLWMTAETTATELYNPGTYIPHERIPVDFKTRFPHGTTQNVLDYVATERNKQMMRQDKLSELPDGLLTDATKYTGETLGALLDPITAGVAAIAPEVVGPLATEARAVLGESKAAQFTGKFVHGAGEGALVGASMGTGNYTYQKELGLEAHPMDILSSIGDGALWGGGLHTLFGARSVLKQSTDDMAQQIASKQMAADKDVDVSAIIKQGIYETGQKMKASGVSAEALITHSNTLNSLLENVDTKISELGEIPKQPTEGLQLLNDRLDDLRVDPLNRSMAQGARLKDFQNIDYFKSLLNISATNPLERTDGMRSVLGKFVDDPSVEKDLIENEKSKLEEVGEKTQDPQLVKKRLELLNNRENELNEQAPLSTEESETLHNYNQLRMLKNDIQNLKDNTDGQLAVLQAQPVSKGEISAAMNAIGSDDSDSFMNSLGDTGFDEAIEETKDMKFYKDKAGEYVKKGYLKPEDLEEAKAQDSADKKNFAGLTAHFDTVIDCLLGE